MFQKFMSQIKFDKFNKKLKIIIFIIFGIIITQIITAYWFNYIAVKQLEKQFVEFTNNPMIKVIKHDVHKGLFGIVQTNEIAVNDAIISNIIDMFNKKPATNTANNITHQQNSSTQGSTPHSISSDYSKYSIKFTTKVSSGIFAALFHGYFAPSLAYAKTEIEYSSKLKNILDKFFDKKSPLKIINILYLNKNGRYIIQSPSFKYEEAVSGLKVFWGGLDYNINYNSSFTHFNNKLLIPNAEIKIPNTINLNVSKLQYESNISNSDNTLKVGNKNLSIDNILVDLQDSIILNLKLGDIISNLTGINSAQILNSIDVINPSKFTLNGLYYQSKSQDIDGFFDFKAYSGFNQLTSNEVHYGPLTLDLQLSHILSKSLSKLLDDLTKLSESQIKTTHLDSNNNISNNINPGTSDNGDNNSLEQQFINIIMQHAKDIFLNQPQFKLNKFELQIPSGMVKLSVDASIKNFKESDINSKDALSKKLDIKFQFSTPKNVLAYLLNLQMKYLLSAGNAEMDEQSLAAFNSVVNILLDNQINAWSKKSYIQNNNGIISGNFMLSDGELLINNIPSK